MLDKLAANRQERSLAVVVEAPSLLAGPIVDADGTIIHHDVRAGNVINRSSARPCGAAAKRVRRAKMVPEKRENTPVFQKNRGKQGVQMSAGYPFRHRRGSP